MQLRYFILGLLLILPLGAAQAESSTTITAADILPLKKKSDKGDADAQYRLGIAYLSGMGGLTADPLRGMDYIEKSGKAGKREAQFFMGAMLHGINARTNFSDQNKTKEQLKWLALSFRQGCAGSAGLIAGYYVTMKGPESPKALEWFMKAAKGGDPYSQALLAKIAKDLKNPVESYAWTALTYREHPELQSAKGQMDALMKEMSAEDKPKAEELAQQFVKDYGRQGDYPFCMVGALKVISPLKY